MRVALTLVGLNVVSFIDRLMLGALLPLLTAEFSLSHTQAGAPLSAFYSGYLVSCAFFGVSRRKYSPQHAIGVGALLFGGATLANAVAPNWGFFLLTRALIGVGEGIFAVNAPVLLRRATPAPVRARAFGFFAGAAPLGTALGYFFGGVVGGTLGWRWALVIVAVAPILLGGFFVVSRANFAVGDDAPAVDSVGSQAAFSRLNYVLLCMVGIMSSALTAGYVHWSPSFAVEKFHKSLREVGIVFTLVLGVVGPLASHAGGVLTQYLDKGRERFSRSTVLMCIGALVVAFFGYAGRFLFAPSFESFLAFSFFGQAGFLLATTVWSMFILEASRPDSRARDMSRALFLATALGGLPAPMVVGAVTDVLKRSAFASNALGMALAGFGVTLLVAASAYVVIYRQRRHRLSISQGFA